MDNTTLGDQKLMRKQRKALEKQKRNGEIQALHTQPLWKINKEGSQYPRRSLRLLPEAQNLDNNIDFILIAIDIEYSHFSAKTGSIRFREIGISILDTRYIRWRKARESDIINTLSNCDGYQTISLREVH